MSLFPTQLYSENCQEAVDYAFKPFDSKKSDMPKDFHDSIKPLVQKYLPVGKRAKPEKLASAVKNYVAILKMVKIFKSDGPESEDAKSWEIQHEAAKKAHNSYKTKNGNKSRLKELTSSHDRVDDLKDDAQNTFTKMMTAAQDASLETLLPAGSKKGGLSEEEKLKFRVACAVQVIKEWESIE